MSGLTDEVLMAYADGQLPPDEAARVATALETNAEARTIVAEFKRTAEVSRAAFDDILAEPVPETIRHALTTSGSQTARFAGRAHHRKPDLTDWQIALPLAASIALVVGMAATLFLRTSSPPNPAQIIALGQVAPEASLATVLEMHTSGVPHLLTGQKAETTDRLMVVATFRDRKARICREVELIDRSLQPHMAAVACRDPARGVWSVEGIARIAAGKPAGGSDFIPSGGEEKDALDGLLKILGATAALSAEEEQALIHKGWK